MSYFYGNANTFDSPNFTFDIIYPNYKTMCETMEQGNDGVFLNRYALINYYYPAKENTNQTYSQTDNYYNNKTIDFNISKKNYHATVWMKTAKGYVQVAQLDTTFLAPNIVSTGTNNKAEQLLTFSVHRPTWEYPVSNIILSCGNSDNTHVTANPDFALLDGDNLYYGTIKE